jgi:chaperonin GroEL
MSKLILDSQNTKQKALETITEMAAVVKRTLGPGGNPIILQRQGQNPDGTPIGPLITKDGVTVAEYVSYRNNTKDTIAKAILQVAKNTVNQAGDGPQPLYSKVLTPKGFIEMRDVRVGMEICGTNGSVQKVLGVFPKGVKEIYEVEIENKGVVECCEDHLWTVCEDTGKRVTKTTAQMQKDFVKVSSSGRKKFKYYIPKTVVNFQDNSLERPLDPYLLGVLIGDGSLRDSGSIELSLGFKKEHIIDALVLPKGLQLNVQGVEDRSYFRVKISGKTEDGKSIRDLIYSLGLGNTESKTKFIPKSYLYAPVEVRERLLAGLIDTDGYINSRGKFEFSTVSSQLASDFKELLWSLGKSFYYNFKERSTDSGAYSNTPVHFFSELSGYQNGDKIIAIRPTGRYTEMQCIKVSNEDSLYITDHYVTTHNTTTAVVLAEAIYRAGYKYIEQGRNSIQLYEELNKVKDEVIEAINKLKKDISKSEIKSVAQISANGNEEIANIVYEAIMAVGEDGHISLEEGTSRETELTKIEGAVYKQGWTSFGPHGALLVTDKQRDICEMRDPAILLYAGVLDDVHALGSLIHKVYQFDSQTKQFTNVVPFLVIANDFSDQVKEFILQNRVQGGYPVAAIKSPFDGSPNARTEMLEDLAALLGAKVSAKGILELRQVTEDHLGSCAKVEISRNEMVIFEGAGDEEEIIQRVEDLKKLAETKLHEFDRENIRIRIGKLTGGIAIVRVGGSSELEILEKKDRIEDALCAARVAIQDGIVAGGGYTLYQISQQLLSNRTDAASVIMAEALQAPIKQIITNVGENPDVVLARMPSHRGYDARNKRYVDLMKQGIIDPAKVTKSALENAVSIAGLLLTTGGAIVLDDTPTSGTPNPLHALLGG